MSCNAYSASDDVQDADQVRTLIKDIWDIRVAKLRKSIDQMIRSQAISAEVWLYSQYLMLSVYVLLLCDCLANELDSDGNQHNSTILDKGSGPLAYA